MSILHKNSIKSSFACICAHSKLSVWVCNLQHWCMCQQLLELLKTSLTFLCPFKFLTFSLQRCDRIINLREVPDEPLVVAFQNHEGSHLIHILRSYPLYDGSYHFYIYCNAFLGDQIPQVMYLSLKKIALVELNIKLMLSQ